LSVNENDIYICSLCLTYARYGGAWGWSHDLHLSFYLPITFSYARTPARLSLYQTARLNWKLITALAEHLLAHWCSLAAFPLHHSTSIEPMEPSVLSHVPPEIWNAIFEHLATHPLHIFDQSVRCRRQHIRHYLLPLMFVCRAWHVSSCYFAHALQCLTRS
jgi:hypothetical protein